MVITCKLLRDRWMVDNKGMLKRHQLKDTVLSINLLVFLFLQFCFEMHYYPHFSRWGN